MAHFENLFVLKQKYNNDVDFYNYICNNFLYNNRFTQTQLFDKIKVDSVEYFGSDIGIYEEAKLLRGVVINYSFMQIENDCDIDNCIDNLIISSDVVSSCCVNCSSQLEPHCEGREVCTNCGLII